MKVLVLHDNYEGIQIKNIGPGYPFKPEVRTYPSHGYVRASGGYWLQSARGTLNFVNTNADVAIQDPDSGN